MSPLFPLLAAAAVLGAPPASSVRRVAVIVGADRAAEGRRPLRFSYDDAQSMADVLTEVGDFQPSDVVVLRDPDPDVVLQTLDRELDVLRPLKQETMLLFYYSGHADAQALYPNGKPLSYQALRARLDQPSATMRIGVVDACSVGGWTQAKGLHPDKPFDIGVPLALASEGSVLIASSSGEESAREAESLHGSFFTHHFVAGLRGAADQSGDGRVTLTEAFAYAQELTIRDSALEGETPQHPSFEMNLRGRGEVPLTEIADRESTLLLRESEGPLQLIQLQTGLIVLEAPAGRRALRLAVAPGRYLVRRKSSRGTFAREISVVAGKTTTVSEESLELVGAQELQTKRFDHPPYPDESTVAGRKVELRLAFGISHGQTTLPTGTTILSGSAAAMFGAYWGITDRLEWPVLLPALAYRFGTRGAWENVVWGGILGWSIGDNAQGHFGFSYNAGLGIDSRKWLGEDRSLILELQAASAGFHGSGLDVPPNTWRGAVSFGYSQSLGDRVTFNLGLYAARNMTYEGHWTGLENNAANSFSVGIGSVQSMGLRPLPLVQLHFLESLSVDGYASVQWNTATHQVDDSYLAGITWTF